MPLFLALILFVASFVIRTDHAFEQDLGRHLKLGEIIWKTHQVPKTNLFSYTNPDFPVIDHHWLFQVLVYLGNFYFGITFLIVIKILLLLLTVAVVLRITMRTKSILFLPISFLFLQLLRERLELRPEVFSFLFTVIILWILEKYDQTKHKKWLFFIPLIQLIWVNMHIYFSVGLFLIGVYWLVYLYQKKWQSLKCLTVLGFISAAATLINPNFITGALYPFTVFNNYGYTIAENQSVFFLQSLDFKDPLFIFYELACLVSITSLVVSFIYSRFNLKYGLLIILGLGLSLMNIRSMPYLLLIGLPGVVHNFGQVSFKKWDKVIIWVTVGLMVFEALFFIDNQYYSSTSFENKFEVGYLDKAKPGIDFVAAHHLPGPIYNNFDIGGYLIYRLYPDQKVFVDNRPEAYPDTFFKNVYLPSEQDPAKFDQLDKQYNFQTVIYGDRDQTPWGAAFLKAITANPKWSVVYIDDFTLVLVKKEILSQYGLQAIDLSQLRPEKVALPGAKQNILLGYVLLEVNQLQAGQSFVQKGVEMLPESPFGNALMEEIERFQNQIYLANQYHDKISSFFWW